MAACGCYTVGSGFLRSFGSDVDGSSSQIRRHAVDVDVHQAPSAVDAGERDERRVHRIAASPPGKYRLLTILPLPLDQRLIACVFPLELFVWLNPRLGNPLRHHRRRLPLRPPSPRRL